MKRITTALITTFLTVLWTGFAFASTWTVDPDHSTAGFAIKHMTISTVRGSFSDINGSAKFDQTGNKLLSIELVINSNSINTGVKKRDDHLKSPDFFDVKLFPTIQFTSTSISETEPGVAKVTGNLTMHGVTREVTVQLNGPTPSITDPWGNVRKGANITTKINRKDYKIIYNKILDNGSLLVGDIADVAVDLEFIEQKNK